MKEDWLWDRSGPPDPEIERLERTLAPLRYRHHPLAPARAPRRNWAVAAAVVAAAAALLVWSVPVAPETLWQVAGATLRQGQTVRTGSAAVRLEAEAIGRVDVAPHSTLRATAPKHLALEHGELHAFIWARPTEFVVETPSARAIDLGCEYTLNVDSAGNGLLRVSMGWVAFTRNGHESFIPANAECRTRKHAGPGVPYYTDAPDALRAAVAAFDAGDRKAVAPILATARERDGLTIWHLLTRVEAADRGAVYDRLAELVPMLPGASREGVIRGETEAIDRCWDALGLENTAWWRGWERKW
jgi:ferric-dicitrate binding protein FerR (iron transport regulator)